MAALYWSKIYFEKVDLLINLLLFDVIRLVLVTQAEHRMPISTLELRATQMEMEDDFSILQALMLY